MRSTPHRAHRVRRVLAIALSALVASAQPACGGAPWADQDAPKASRAPIEVWEIEGSVRREHDGQLAEAAPGMTVAQGDRILTGPDGRAVLMAPPPQGSPEGTPGQPIRVGHGTSARLVRSTDEVVELELERGQVRARVRAPAGAPRTAVRVTAQGRAVQTADGDVAVAVDDQQRLAVEVVEGEVALEGVVGASRLSAGQRALARPGQAARVSSVTDEPLLDVKWPGSTRSATVTLTGVVEPGARVRWVEGGAAVGDEEARAGDDGRFALIVRLGEGAQLVTLEVIDAFGRSRRATASVVRDTTAPRIEVDLRYPGR
jgi:hypothetical protein